MKGSSQACVPGSQALDKLHDLPEASSVRGDPAGGDSGAGRRSVSHSAAFPSARGQPGAHGSGLCVPSTLLRIVSHLSLPPASLAAKARAPEQMAFTPQGPRARGRAGVTGRLGTLDPAAR